MNKFITIEGVDGAGKSTHVESICNYLKNLGHEVIHTREPGGTAIGEKLREMLLNENMSPETETMLMFAARKEHIETIIKPALERGAFVVCDRFSDSTWAYQAGGKNVSKDFIQSLEEITHFEINPSLTILFDLPVEISMDRLKKTDKIPDKFEREDINFFNNVRNEYLNRAKKNNRFKIIDSQKTPEHCEKTAISYINKFLLQLNSEKTLSSEYSIKHK